MSIETQDPVIRFISDSSEVLQTRSSKPWDRITLSCLLNLPNLEQFYAVRPKPETPKALNRSRPWALKP